ELLQRLDHHISVAHVREGAIDLPQILLPSAQSAAVISRDEIRDRSNLLDGFSRFVNRLVRRRRRSTQVVAGRPQLFSGKATRAMTYRFVGFQVKGHTTDGLADFGPGEPSLWTSEPGQPPAHGEPFDAASRRARDERSITRACTHTRTYLMCFRT